MNIRLLKLVDAIVGRSACAVLSRVVTTKPETLPGSPHRIQSVLFIRPGGIGDAVLMVPAIDALKRAFPETRISVLAEKRNSAVFSLTRTVDKVFHYERLNELRGALRNSYDVVIDSEQWHRLSAIVARLTRAPMTIGFATNERKKLFTHPVPYSHDDHEMESFLHLIEPLIGTVAGEINAPFLTIEPEMSLAVGSLLKPLSSRKIVALFPGGSIEERKWGSDRFRETAQRLSGLGYGIVVIGGKDDIKAGREIVTGISPVLNLCGKLSLPDTAAVLKKSSLLISGDSGIMHVGYGLGTNIVALFGPGREKKWAPRGTNCVVINKHLPCSPCTTFGYTPKCSINAACMKLITVEEVYAQAINLLRSSS